VGCPEGCGWLREGGSTRGQVAAFTQQRQLFDSAAPYFRQHLDRSSQPAPTMTQVTSELTSKLTSYGVGLADSARLHRVVSSDAPEPWGIGFQDAASPVFEGITELHDTIFFYLLVIGFGVTWVIASVVVGFNASASPLSHKYYNHGTLVELIWTITPAMVLIALALPSFKLLYLADEVITPSMTIKAVGHQWYQEVTLP